MIIYIPIYDLYIGMYMIVERKQGFSKYARKSAFFWKVENRYCPDRLVGCWVGAW